MVASKAVLTGFLLLGLPLVAQSIPHNNLPFGTTPEVQRGNDSSILLSGTVALEGGGRVPQPVTVLIECDGQTALSSSADTDGTFQFRLVDAGGPGKAGWFDNSNATRMWQVCDLRAEAAGYLSSKRALSNIVGEMGMVNVGTILLHATQQAPGFLISAADAEVTKNARKDFEKGQKAAKKGLWQAARERFQHAVSECPRFVSAWVALGHVQTEENNWMAASQSYHTALQVDSRLPMAYAGLAEIAAQQSRWPDLADATSRLLALYPSQYPQFWFLNGVANFNMKKFDDAERSVLRSIQFDSQHQITRNEYLLGLILAIKQNYHDAAEHLRVYLQASPNDESAGQARKQLAEFERLAAITHVAAPVAAGK